MIQGEAQLRARLTAVANAPKGMLRNLAVSAVREQKLLVHRKTGTTGRSIHVGRITDTSAETVVGGAGPFLEFGTRPHTIVPRRRKVLAWPATGAGARLSGRARSSTRRGGNGGMRFARRVRHPGTKAYPFMLPGAQKAVAQAGGLEAIVDAWNGAA